MIFGKIIYDQLYWLLWASTIASSTRRNGIAKLLSNEVSWSAMQLANSDT